jgi:hypothetical protein
MVVVGVAVVVAVNRLPAALALAPRAIDVAIAALCGVKHAHARAIGWRETALLAAAVFILAAAMR